MGLVDEILFFQELVNYAPGILQGLTASVCRIKHKRSWHLLLTGLNNQNLRRPAMTFVVCQ